MVGCGGLHHHNTLNSAPTTPDSIQTKLAHRSQSWNPPHVTRSASYPNTLKTSPDKKSHIVASSHQPCSTPGASQHVALMQSHTRVPTNGQLRDKGSAPATDQQESACADGMEMHST